jgi:hypothetical protein
MKRLFFLLCISLVYGKDNYYFYGLNDKVITLQPIVVTKEASKASTTLNDIEFYKTDINQTIGIKNEFIVALKKNGNILTLQSKYKIELTKALKYNRYIFKTDSIETMFEIVNKIHKDENVEYAYPHYVREVTFR